MTSGTAAAELHPAVIEADLARVPVLVCTADRPPELQGVGAPQTIDQVGLFGPAVRWAAAPGVPQEAQRPSWRSLAARALAEATVGPFGPGPVHLNLAFREPLVARADALPAASPDGGTGSPGAGRGRRARALRAAAATPCPVAGELAGRAGAGGRRGLRVARSVLRWRLPATWDGRCWPTPARAAGWTTPWWWRRPTPWSERNSPEAHCVRRW